MTTLPKAGIWPDSLPIPGKVKVIEAWVLDAIKRAVGDTVLACAHLRGQGDKDAADEAACAAMRGTLQDYLPVRAQVVIGEGQLDKAPMLHVGEELGPDTPVLVYIAVDPIDGTTNCAENFADGAIAVIAAALAGEEGGQLFGSTYEGYMDKFFIGPKTWERWLHCREKQLTPREAPGFDPHLSPFEQDLEAVVRFVAYANELHPDQLVAAMLRRPRHQHYLDTLRSPGLRVQVQLVEHGDVALAFNVQDPDHDALFTLGAGGSPEAVLSAAGVRVSGGYGWTKWYFENKAKERQGRAALEAEGINPDQIYTVDDLASGNVMIAYAAITNTERLDGYRIVNGAPQVQTYYGRSRSGTSGIQTTWHTDPPRRITL